MRFPSFLKRSPDAHRPSGRVQLEQDPASVELLRTRTRRRLIGAAILVGVGVVALPMLLETTPRPMPPASIDLTRGGVAPVGVEVAAQAVGRTPTAPSGSAEATRNAPEADRSEADAKSAASAGASAAASGPLAPNAPAARPLPARSVPAVPRPAVAPAERREPPARAASRPVAKPAAVDSKPQPAPPVKAQPRANEDKPRNERVTRSEAPPKPDEHTAGKRSEAPTKVWIQVGAYAEAATVKSVRQRVDKLGLKSQEQMIETASGKRTRVRLGPFASKAEADQAVAKLRAGGLGATVVSP